MSGTVVYQLLQVIRLSNHPEHVEILPILLENPKSRPMCDRDRKNPDFDISDISYEFLWYFYKNRVYLTENDIQKNEI